MKEFRSRLSEDGRIVIPAVFRRQMHLELGEELIIKMSQDELHVISAKQSLKNAQRRVKALTQGKSLIEQLKILRQEDNANG